MCWLTQPLLLILFFSEELFYNLDVRICVSEYPVCVGAQKDQKRALDSCSVTRCCEQSDVASRVLRVRTFLEESTEKNTPGARRMARLRMCPLCEQEEPSQNLKHPRKCQVWYLRQQHWLRAGEHSWGTQQFSVSQSSPVSSPFIRRPCSKI